MSSIVPPDRGPDTEPIEKIRTTERTRAALVLGVLAVVAVLVVGIMVYTMGSSDTSTNTTPGAQGPSGPAVTVTGGAPTSSTASGTPSRTQPSKSATSRTRTRTGPVSCPSASPCALPDDVGNALRAVNAYRAAHGRAAVTGAVTRPARNCALQNGDGSACPSGYYWEPVGRSGNEVVDKIAKSGKGVGWLLDPKFTKLQIGWVYIPSSKSYECVLVSNA